MVPCFGNYEQDIKVIKRSEESLRKFAEAASGVNRMKFDENLSGEKPEEIFI
jgi:hypothetical protein